MERVGEKKLTTPSLGGGEVDLDALMYNCDKVSIQTASAHMIY